MIDGKTIGVVIPAYNEETQIETVIKTMPAFVDRIVVVNDCSKDKTAKVVEKLIKEDKANVVSLNGRQKLVKNKYNAAEFVLEDIEDKEAVLFTPAKIFNSKPNESRIILINHTQNGGVGAAMATGYKWCRDNEIDVTGLMGGDGQMDPSELIKIVQPVVDGKADYVKANRLKHRSAFFVIPKIRFFGNSILSLLNKIATGYWKVSDSQTGFTAVSLPALKAIRLHKIYSSYGCPNDMLVKLNIAFCTLKEVESKPVYNVGEKSKMRELKVIPRISWLLFKSFWKRLYIKYLFRDFHPLFLLYHMSFLLLLANIPFTIQVIKAISPSVTLPIQSLIIFIFLSISGFQSLFFAMWMDMMDNERLYIE